VVAPTVPVPPFEDVTPNATAVIPLGLAFPKASRAVKVKVRFWVDWTVLPEAVIKLFERLNGPGEIFISEVHEVPRLPELAFR
jgi:hypothetical protein